MKRTTSFDLSLENAIEILLQRFFGPIHVTEDNFQSSHLVGEEAATKRCSVIKIIYISMCTLTDCCKKRESVTCI